MLLDIMHAAPHLPKSHDTLLPVAKSLV